MTGSGTGWETPGAVSTPAAPSVGTAGAGSGWESPVGAPTASAQGGGGGFMHDLGSVGHFVSSRLATGMSSIKSIGTGLYDAAKVGAVDPWRNLITTGHPYTNGTGNKIDAETNAVLGGTITGPVNAVHDIASGKFKDPIGDAIMLLPAAHGLARGGIGVAEGSAALRSGEGLKGAVSAAKTSDFLHSPRLINEPGREPVSLYASHNAARRLVQSGIDKMVNKALANDNAKGVLGHEGPVASYGKARMGGTVADYARASIRYRQAMIATTRVAARGVDQFAKKIKTDVANPSLTAQAILHSLHDNVLPEHEAIMHEQQAARGVNPEQNAAWAQAFKDAAGLNVVRLSEDNRVTLNEGHPLAQPLLRADNALAKLGAYSENEIIARGLRDPLELADRRGRVAQLVQRGAPLRGAEPQALADARRSLAKAQAVHTKNLDAEAKWRAGKGQKTLEGQRVSPGPNLTQGGKLAGESEFRPSRSWQQVPKGVAIPPGAEIRMDMNGGAPHVRWDNPPEEPVKYQTPEASNPHRNRAVLSGQKLEEAKARVQQFEDRYGFSSPERRVAQQQGVAARERLAGAAHQLFGDHAAQHLSQIEAHARQWARVNDRTPEEWYASHLRDTQVSPTLEHLPEDIAPLYEAQPALQREPLPQLDPKAISHAILERGDIKLPRGWTPAHIEAAVNRVMPLVEEGAPYRDWYARGASVLKDAAKRIGVGTKEFLNAVAITSQGANPTFNLKMAARAAKEFKDTGAITHDVSRLRFPQRQIPELMNAMRGKTIESAKRNSYYGNFLHELSPKDFAKEFGARLDPVTVDRHVARMLFDTTSPTDVQYKIGEAIFQEIAKRLGWKAKEVQAAAWVPWKAQGLEASAIERAGKAGREPVAGGYQRHLPSAADAYERGHAENIGTLYHRSDVESQLERAGTGDAAALGGTERPWLRVRRAGGSGLVRFTELHSPEELALFERALGENARAENLAPHTPEELAHNRVFLSEDGKTGFMVSPEGDLQNVFNNPGGVKGAGGDAVALAVHLGAKTLDAYDGFLTDFYRGHGFGVTGRMRFNDEYAPPGWDYGKNGRPDVVFMARGAHDLAAAAPHFEDWDAAKAHSQQSSVIPQAEGGVVRGSYTPEQGTMNLSSEHATPETIVHEALHAVRQSLSPTVSEIARRLYAPNGWDRAAEEHFVEDMQRAQNGEQVSPEAQRLFLMTHSYVPGRGYVPMTVWEDARQPNSPMASSASPIIGDAKKPLNTHFATGEATAQGLRRTDVAEAVTAHVQKLFRYFNTVDHRELAAKFGGDTRLSSGDVLMRYDRRTEGGFKLPAQKVGEVLKETLGLLENKTGLPAAEEEGLSAGVSAVLRDFVGDLFPGKFSPHTEVQLENGTTTTAGQLEATAERGAKAPAGYKWVPSEVARLKDLEAAVTHGEPSRIGRFADNVNGGITAATVYYKVGHFFTRYLTNASTNIMQGSAAPWQIARSVELWHTLTEDERQQALAYSGTHYYEAAPGAQGGTVVGKGMQKGLHIPFTDIALRTKSGEGVMSPQFWAHHVDAPFRFNSIAFEARQAGYEGAEGFRQFLHDVEGYGQLDAADRARVDGVLRRADREAIAYDRMNQFEKKWLTRIIWFYPWIKGSTVFTANSFLEHPFKSAALYGYGEQGAQQRDKVLGDLPSYAQGLTPLTGGSEPVVSDFNTFNPWSTAADLLDIPGHIGNVAGMANPLYGAVLNTAEGVNPYGAHTPTPITDNLKGLLSSAPEYQIGASALDHGDQSHRLYPGGHGLNPLYKNWLGELTRAFGSPATPRHVNPEAGHSLAQRERTGR